MGMDAPGKGGRRAFPINIRHRHSTFPRPGDSARRSRALHRRPAAPRPVRMQRFAMRLPRYLVAALERLAEENEESAEALLTRELHGLAWTHRERLGEAIPGVAGAGGWPLGGGGGGGWGGVGRGLGVFFSPGA